ncbi:HNH endonuclease [Lacticaseibacillus sp. N501-2]|uniref:HNH endonuclease n=1 Tax=Lacticaseibacillus salsurae TaxID=3367729 RepID=UPI0038B244BC
MIYKNTKQMYGLALTRLRVARGLSRQNVVDNNEISLNALSSIENGQAQIKLENLEMLLDYYQISAEDFFRDYVNNNDHQSDLDTLWENFDADTRFFILDTKGAVDANNYADQDFERYQWDASHFNKVREGDWFIYRRPKQGNKQFSLFGAGQIGHIEEGPAKQRTATLVNTFAFPHYLFGDDDLVDYQWHFKKRTRLDWQRFFNQYGMTTIDRQDFVALITMAMQTEPLPISPSLIQEESAIYHSIRSGDYTITDRVSKTKQRVGQQIVAEMVKDNYAYHCAVTGIHTREFLVASHIIPWAADPKKRLDPTNVICLSTLWDRAFDQGFITFNAKDYSISTSPKLQEDSALAGMFNGYAGRQLHLPRHGAPSKVALEYHNDVVFKR